MTKSPVVLDMIDPDGDWYVRLPTGVEVTDAQAIEIAQAARIEHLRDQGELWDEEPDPPPAPMRVVRTMWARWIPVNPEYRDFDTGTHTFHHLATDEAPANRRGWFRVVWCREVVE